MDDFYSDFEKELDNYREVFKHHIVYPNGKVKDTRTGKYVKPGKNRSIRLEDSEGKAVVFSLPHLVATMFVENKTNGNHVKHYDSDFKNFDPDNLYWTKTNDKGLRKELVLRVGD